MRGSFPPTDPHASPKISACLSEISLWMGTHQLKINPNKTELWFIPADSSLHQDLAISLDNSPVFPLVTPFVMVLLGAHQEPNFLFPNALILSVNTSAGSELGAGAGTGTVHCQSENALLCFLML